MKRGGDRLALRMGKTCLRMTIDENLKGFLAVDLGNEFHLAKRQQPGEAFNFFIQLIQRLPHQFSLCAFHIKRLAKNFHGLKFVLLLLKGFFNPRFRRRRLFRFGNLGQVCGTLFDSIFYVADGRLCNFPSGVANRFQKYPQLVSLFYERFGIAGKRLSFKSV